MIFTNPGVEPVTVETDCVASTEVSSILNLTSTLAVAAAQV